MKRFRFQLQSVLDYKTKALESLMVELDQAQARVMAQEYKRDQALQNIAAHDAAFAEKRTQGFTNIDALEYGNSRVVLEQRARREQQLLDRRRQELEKKRQEVVEARQETHAIEKLRDIRRGEYDTALAKSEEKMLDDLVATRRAMAAG